MATQTIHDVGAISLAEQAKRRALVQKTIRLNRSEGLEPTARHRELDKRFIAGEIDFDEYTRTVLSW